MKRCPECQHTYTDETVRFCRLDGISLVNDSEFSETQILPAVRQSAELPTQLLQNTPSIAVLPFSNMSADAENEYFCDGLAEELLNALAKIEKLKVAARTSAFSFKGKNSNANEIGKILGVNTILEGSVRKSGNRLRITVQLINAADGYHLWSERYDREMKDIFDVQDEITLAVVDALKVKLFREEKAAVLKRYTDNTEAYEAYLKGLYYNNKYTGEGWLKAVEYFDTATQIDSDYALPYGAKATSQHYLYFYAVYPPDKIVPQWRETINRALELNEDLSEAHLSLGNFYFYYERDWEKAEREFKRAVELNPRNPVRHLYGLFLAAAGRFDEAIREGEIALELDPLSLLNNLNVGWIYWLASRFDDALRQVERMIEIEPNFFGAYWQMGTVQMSKGQFEESVKSLKKSVALGGTLHVLSPLAAAYGRAGRRDEAFAIIDQLLEIRKNSYVTAYSIARVYAGLNDTDKTYEWLEKALEERNGELVYLNVISSEPNGLLWGKDFRTDSRFQNLMQRVGLTL